MSTPSPRTLAQDKRREANRAAFRSAACYSEARDVAARECDVLYLPESPAESVTASDGGWTLVTPTFFTKRDQPECVKQHRAAQAVRAQEWLSVRQAADSIREMAPEGHSMGGQDAAVWGD